MSRNWLVRLETSGISTDLAAGLVAKLYDPAWTLGRQWQLGEFLGDDAGTPVAADVEGSVATLARYRPGGGPWQRYDPAAVPLDALAEPDAQRTAATWTSRARVDAGRAFVRALADTGVGDHAAAFAHDYELAPAAPADRTVDVAAARLLDVTAGRVPDGEQLYTALVPVLRAGGQIPLPASVPGGDADAVRTAAAEWLRWCDETAVEPGAAGAGGGSWDDEKLSYGFSAASDPPDVVVDAVEHRGGGLDWYSFSARPVAGAAAFRPLPMTQTLPTAVTFRGMPASRWWELEDASVDLGAVDAGPSDVARLAVLEFSLVYGNDFFAVPIRVPVGSLTRIDRLVVTDSFGMRLRIDPAAHGTGGRQGARRWTMFTLTERAEGAREASGVSDLLFLPPVARHLLTGAPVEKVLLLRDEMANLAWAVESTYEGGSGTALPRAEQEPRREPPAPPPAGTTPAYRLGTGVPSFWFPLVPERGGGDLRLRLSRMGDQDPSIRPRGRLLTLGGPTIADGEVPREGLRLSREWVVARWSNGSTLAWARRLKRVGRGEGSSGLRFDAVVTPEE